MYHTEILSNERDEFIQWMNSQSRNYKMYPTGKEVDEADREMLDQEYLPFYLRIVTRIPVSGSIMMRREDM